MAWTRRPVRDRADRTPRNRSTARRDDRGGRGGRDGARGVRERCAADWGLAPTGVAGPEPQDGKPVGLVYVAVAGPDGATVRELKLDGNRDAIRTESVTSALLLLADCLQEAPARS